MAMGDRNVSKGFSFVTTYNKVKGYSSLLVCGVTPVRALGRGANAAYYGSPPRASPLPIAYMADLESTPAKDATDYVSPPQASLLPVNDI